MQGQNKLQNRSMLAQLIIDLPDCAFCIDTQENIVICNPAAESLLGYCCSELQQANFTSLLFGTKGDVINSNLDLNKLITAQESCEITICHKSGNLIPVLLSVKAIADPANLNETLHLCILKDIRSLNLSTAVGIALYESLRRTGFTNSWPLL